MNLLTEYKKEKDSRKKERLFAICQIIINKNSYLFKCLCSIVPNNPPYVSKFRHDLNRYDFSNIFINT